MENTGDLLKMEKPWYAKVDNETPEMLQSWVNLLDKQLADPNFKLTEIGKQDIVTGRGEIAARLAELQPQETPVTP
jgi:hypothetical protein